MIEEFNQIYASDGDFFDQIKLKMEKNNESGILANWVTCRREDGKIVIRNPEVI
jgi:hypothetical protein